VTADDLPDEVRSLIARHLESMDQVDALLVLHQTPDRGWTAAEVADKLRVEPKGIVRALEHLDAAGLIARDAARAHAYRYAPDTTVLARATQSLLDMYNRRPVTLIRAIYDRPPSAVRSFADAFRLRPPKD
jgi:hypothetical protein